MRLLPSALFFCVIALTAGHAYAVPPLMGYSGRLLDSSNAPLSGTYSMDFRIYDALSSGTLLYEENIASVDVVDGYFSVVLGASPSVGDPLDQIFALNESGLFLEVAVNAETLSPRQTLTAVPWAYGVGQIVAGGGGGGGGGSGVTSVTVDGKGLISGNATDGDITLSARSCASTGQILEWNGSSWVCATPSGGTSIDCPSGYFPVKVGSAWACSDANATTIKINSSVPTPQLTLEETEVDYARVTFKNTSSNSWTVAARGHDALSSAQFNIYHSTAGDIVRVFANNRVLVNGMVAATGAYSHDSVYESAAVLRAKNTSTDTTTASLRKVGIYGAATGNGVSSSTGGGHVTKIGVVGEATGTAEFNIGVTGSASGSTEKGNIGVLGRADAGSTTTAKGVYGATSGSGGTAWAGYFNGNVQIVGELTVVEGYIIANTDGTPSGNDCNSDTEKGRMVYDSNKYRLYFCNGATRGWDYIAVSSN